MESACPFVCLYCDNSSKTGPIDLKPGAISSSKLRKIDIKWA